jgi:hypothetical protein
MQDYSYSNTSLGLVQTALGLAGYPLSASRTDRCTQPKKRTSSQNGCACGHQGMLLQLLPQVAVCANYVIRHLLIQDG